MLASMNGRGVQDAAVDVRLRRKVDDGSDLFLLQDVGDQFPVADVAPVEFELAAALRQPGQVSGIGELVQDCYIITRFTASRTKALPMKPAPPVTSNRTQITPLSFK